MAMLAHLLRSIPSGNLPSYLDPGTGSIVLQVIIAAGMSGLFLLGVFRKKLAAFFNRLAGRPQEDRLNDDD
jgi:hypothetical protein